MYSVTGTDRPLVELGGDGSLRRLSPTLRERGGKRGTGTADLLRPSGGDREDSRRKDGRNREEFQGTLAPAANAPEP